MKDKAMNDIIEFIWILMQWDGQLRTKFKDVLQAAAWVKASNSFPKFNPWTSGPDLTFSSGQLQIVLWQNWLSYKILQDESS